MFTSVSFFIFTTIVFAAPIDIEFPVQPAVAPKPDVLIHNGMLIDFGNGTTSFLMKECDLKNGDVEKVVETSCRFCLVDNPDTCFSHATSINMDRMMALHPTKEREEAQVDD